MMVRNCKTCRFYAANIGFRGEPYCNRLKKFIGTTLACTEWQENKPKTNYDRLIRMTPEELAEWIFREPTIGGLVCPPGTKDGEDCPTSPCEQCWLDWLKQEVTNDG